MDMINPAAKKQIRNYFLTTKILFFAVFGGVFLFALGVWIYTGYAAEPADPSLDKVLRIAVPISTGALLVMSYLLYGVRLRAAQSQKTMHQKMELYRTAWLLRVMTLDGAGFLNIIAFVLTCNELYYYLLGVILFSFMLNFPTVERFISEMKLSHMEEKVVRDHLSA